MENSTQYNVLRYQLVNTLKKKGITNEEVLKAIENIPRHLFINQNLFTPEEAYNDTPLPIGEGQTISQPFTVAYQTQLLQAGSGNKVLEIGTGSGYQAAVLAEMGAQVYTIERQKKLYDSTKKLFTELGYTAIQMFYGDGNDGLKEQAPFDRILITAAATEIPSELVKQLKIGGFMVLPLNGHIQKMTRITKKSDSKIEIEKFEYFQFVPLLPGIEK